IPNTVAGAVEVATLLGVWMLNVHAAGGARMMRAAREAAHATAARERRPVPLVIAVTVLTSMDETSLAASGVGAPVLDHVVRLAQLAREAGLDGVVASPRETALIRAQCGATFTIVTPGIRGSGAAPVRADDQARPMSAAEAVAAGATYIVVGRPIIEAANPRRAATAILETLRPAR
ncbi:MAG: orotidine-5'-phosphate decarboxylase, partial [Acidobacteria bacterium]|nr:orotidine-5'-phosphate decarboxylase [Acidobacteriota bacterium]